MQLSETHAQCVTLGMSDVVRRRVMMCDQSPFW